MSGYVYMKILESRPKRYDRGIALLSLGKVERVRRRLIDENVSPGVEVLDIGCGTGTAAILAARKGAAVLGFDISGGMLDVARAKAEAAGLGESIDLQEMGIAGMDKLADGRFDLVISTLVFSELSPDEQGYAMRHAYRTLKPGGRLAIADEVRARNVGLRLLHAVVRIPLLFITFALTQTATHAVEGLPHLASQAGFRIVTEERTSLDSFLYLVAVKEPDR